MNAQACTYTHMHTQTQTGTHTCTHTHTHTLTHTHNDVHTQITYSRANARAHRHVQAIHTHTAKQHAHSWLNAQANKHARYTHTLIHSLAEVTCSHTCTRIHVHENTPTDIQIYTRTNAHTQHTRAYQYACIHIYGARTHSNTHKQTRKHMHTRENAHILTWERHTSKWQVYAHLRTHTPVSICRLFRWERDMHIVAFQINGHDIYSYLLEKNKFKTSLFKPPHLKNIHEISL